MMGNKNSDDDEPEKIMFLTIEKSILMGGMIE